MSATTLSAILPKLALLSQFSSVLTLQFTIWPSFQLRSMQLSLFFLPLCLYSSKFSSKSLRALISLELMYIPSVQQFISWFFCLLPSLFLYKSGDLMDQPMNKIAIGYNVIHSKLLYPFSCYIWYVVYQPFKIIVIYFNRISTSLNHLSSLLQTTYKYYNIIILNNMMQ